MGSSVAPLTGQDGQIVTTPQTGSTPRSATEIASQEARARIAAGGSALPPGPGPARNAANGQFVEPTVKPVVEPAAAVAPAAGQPAPVAPAAPAQGAAAPPANETPEAKLARETAEAAAAAAAETPEAKAEREAQEALTIELPFEVEEGQEPLAITADSPETAAALAELVAEAVSGREAAVVIENAQRQLQQHEEVREYAGVDPVGFTINMIGKDIEQAKHVLLFLATQPTLFEQVKADLQKLVTDPNHLKVLGADMRDKRATMRQAGEEQIATSRAVRQNLSDLQTTVAAMLPSDMPDAQRRIAFVDCMRDLQEFADSQNMMTLPVNQVPDALRNRLTALGVDLEEAAARAAVAAARRGGTKPSARAAIPAAPRRPAAPAKPTAPRNGAAFVAGSVKRKQAAAPGAGAGAPSGAAPLELPRNADGTVMSSAQAVAWHRARVAKGQRSW